MSDSLAFNEQRRITELASQAFDVAPDRREAWLEEACQGDARLLKEVSALLEVMASGTSFTRLEALKPGGGAAAIDGRTWLGKTIGSYRIVNTLGEGGMGWVFLAEQTHPIERRVALKIIKPVAGCDGFNAKLQTVFPPFMALTVGNMPAESDSPLDAIGSAVSERIQAEPQMLAKFTHPYIAQVYEAGKTGEGFVYFAMEYVSGEPLIHFCRTAGLGLEQRLFLFMKVCRGVQHAHHNGVLHLDLKPSNILVSDIDGTASPKVIDFGIAMSTDPHGGSRLRRNLTMGTPAYMCPEAQSGSEVSLDARADVYALGVILFELVTGTPAYSLPAHVEGRPASMPGSDHGIRKDGWFSPKKNKRTLSKDLDWIVQKATARNRDDRYHSPADLAEDLKRFFNGKPVAAAPPSPLYLIRKFIARHKWVTAGAGLILAVTFAGLWFLWVSYRRANDAHEVSQRTSQFLTAVIDHTSWRPEDLDLETFLNNAERLLDRQLGMSSLTRAHYMMLLADVYFRTGQLERAEPLIQEALEILTDDTPDHPGLIPFLLVRGKIYQAKGRLDPAEADFLQAVNISERRLNGRKIDYPLFLLAKVYDIGGRNEACEAACRRALKAIGEAGRSRNYRRLLGLLAHSLRKQGRVNEAAEYERRLVAMPPPRHRGLPPPLD